MDDTAMRQAILSRFPEGTVQDVRFQRHDTTKVLGLLEPGQISVYVVPAGPEAYRADPTTAPQEVAEQVVQEFLYQYEPVLRQLAQDLPGMLTERLRSVGVHFGRFAYGATAGETPPAERELVPVVVRLSPTELETLDLLMSAGMAASRTDAVRWCLGRMRDAAVDEQQKGDASNG